MSGRVARAAVAACVASLGAAMTGGAATLGSPPVISSLGGYVVSPGQQLVINGNHFSSDLSPGDCGLSGLPTVIFNAVDGSGAHAVKPSSTGPGVCTNQRLVVQVPSFNVAARIQVLDPSNTSTNTSGSGFYPQVTIQPSGSDSPSAGPVGTQVTINGNNLHPPTVSSSLTLTVGGQVKPANWGSSISFAPGISSGDTWISFQVSGDANNPNLQSQQVSMSAGTFTFQPPTLQGGTIAGKVVGDRITLGGANLGSGGSLTFPGGLAGQGVSWSPGAISSTIPPGAQSGAIGVSVNGYGSVSAPSISLNPLVKAITPNRGSAGDAVNLSGYNFGSSSGKVTTGGVDQAVNSWSDQSITFTLSADSDTGSTVITRADNVAANAVDLAIVPHIDKLESDNVPGGSQVVVDGKSLGSTAGSASVGGHPAAILLWSRDSVLVGLPTDLQPGRYPLVLTAASGVPSNALPITIVAGQAPGSSGGPGGGGSSTAPSFDNSHGFVKPPKTDSAVQLTLDANPHQASPGSSADLTVTLKLKGKPVKGATVELSMLASPNNDYAFTPAHGVTDADGVLKATVKISGKPGENVILAQSGVFSDQDHVTGQSSASAGSVNPAGPFAWPLLAVGVAALALLVGFGFLQLRAVRLLA
ncbi:MAG TPA: IPT/TIG domain-containing protein [Candidatus Dormibacteraeota bacterium]|jgi:hypothetical protein|nr:IPT/TIG domain-containing protein [Candidatus Dormibacteraeota bacterium]